MNLAEKIYKLRTQQNLSQGDLADMLDVSRQSISKWETGNAVPELDKLMKMCDVFGVSLDELTDRTEEAPKKPAPITTTLSHSEILGYIMLIAALFAGILCVINNYTIYFLTLVLPFLSASIILLKMKDRGTYWAKWVTIGGVCIHLSMQYGMKIFFPLLLAGTAGMYFYSRKYLSVNKPRKEMSVGSLIFSWTALLSSFTAFLIYRSSDSWVMNIRPEISYNTVTGATEYTYTWFEKLKMDYGQYLTYFILAAFMVAFAYLFYQSVYKVVKKRSEE